MYIYVWSGSAYTGLDGCKPQQTNFFSSAKNQTGPNRLPFEAQPNHRFGLVFSFTPTQNQTQTKSNLYSLFLVFFFLLFNCKVFYFYFLSKAHFVSRDGIRDVNWCDKKITEDKRRLNSGLGLGLRG